MARIIILAARHWEMRDDKTGELRSGVKFDGCEMFQNDEPRYRGRGAVEYQASPEAFKSLSKVQLPAICDVELGVRKGKNKNGASVPLASVEVVHATHPIDFNVPAMKAAA